MNVVLISRDHRLGAILTMALPSPEGLTLLGSPAEVPDTREAEIDAVVLDLPADSRRDAYEELRQRYEGRVVVPVDNARDTNGWPPDSRRRFLVRPFQVADLIAGVQEPEETSVAERAAKYRRLFRWNRQQLPAFPDISTPPATEQPPAAAETPDRPFEEVAPPEAAPAEHLEAAEERRPDTEAEDEQRPDAEDEAPVDAEAEDEDEQRLEAAAEDDTGAEDEDQQQIDAEAAVEAPSVAETQDEDDELPDAIEADERIEPEAEAEEPLEAEDEADADAAAETEEFLAVGVEDDDQAEAEAEEPLEAEDDADRDDELEDEERAVAAAVEAALREDLDEDWELAGEDEQQPAAEGAEQVPVAAEGASASEQAGEQPSSVSPLPVQAGVAMAEAVALQQWLEAEQAKRTRGRRRRVLANVAAGVVLLLAGIGIGMAIGSDEPQQVSPPVTPQPVVQIRNAPPPAACTQAMDNADAVISYLVAKIRDARLSEAIQDYGANARACRRTGGSP